MPNFDAFERTLRRALAGELPRDIAAHTIAGLPEGQKPRCVKARSSNELLPFLDRAAAALGRHLGPDAVLTTSDSNQSGKDLLDTVSGQTIELKSGPSMTDANAGLGSIAWALNEDDGAPLRALFSSSAADRRALYLRDPGPVRPATIDALHASKRKTMDEALDYIMKRVSVGAEASKRMSHFLRCVGDGLTTAHAIQSSFERPTRNLPLLLMADWSEGLVPYSKSFLPCERIIVTALDRNPERFQLVLTGELSGRSAMIYPHYKNSYRDTATGRVVPCEYWVKNPCFHVWIGSRAP